MASAWLSDHPPSSKALASSNTFANLMAPLLGLLLLQPEDAAPGDSPLHPEASATCHPPV